MSKTTLQAEPRSEMGHKAKSLRNKGIIPATVYGKNVPSVSLGITADAFISTYESTGETGLIELVVGKDRRPVMVHHVQRHPVTGDIIHVEFHQVNLREKVTAPVPVKFAGESPAIKDNKGTLLTLVDEIEIEALPTDLPDHVEVDISVLTDVNQEITVSTIVVPATLTIITDPNVAIVRIAAPIKEEEVAAPPATETPEAAATEPTTDTPQETDTSTQ